MKSIFYKVLIRIGILPIGLLQIFIDISNKASRDIHNKLRFKRSVIDSNCCIDSTTQIAEHAHLLRGCYLIDSYIGKYTYLGKNSFVQKTTIGSFCSIADNVLIGPGKHPLDFFSTSPIFYRKCNTFNISLVEQDMSFNEYERVDIGSDVWIGYGAIIMGGVKVGDGAVIGANAVVTKDVEPYSIVAGSPAKLIRFRFHHNKIKKLLELKWWEWPINEIKDKLEQLKSL